jgi:hypothetical protein
MFSIPEWVKQHDVRDTWFEMIRLLVLRECVNKLDDLRTPEINESLLTLRIYREDIEFWEEYEAELEHLVHTFLKHTQQMPALEYDVLEKYVKEKLRHLTWSAQELSHALIIIAKIRGQLRPMRHAGFDLNEFSFGVVQHSVPTEMRPEVLASWHNLIDKNKKSHDILGDIWQVASIASVSKGRNIPLYIYRTIHQYLQENEQKNICMAIEKAIPLWITTQENPTFHFMFEVEGVRPIHFDIITDKCTYFVFFDPLFVPNNDDKILLLLKQYAYDELFDKALESIGFLNIATGIVTKYEITPTIREQLSHMWRHLQMKYHLYE